MIQVFELNRRQFQDRARGPIMSDAEIRKWTQLNNEIKTLEHNLQILGQHLEAYFIGPLNRLTGEAVRLVEGGKLTKGEQVATALAVGPTPENVGNLMMQGLFKLLEHVPGTKTITAKTDIHVHGTTNPEHVAKEVVRHVERAQRGLTTALQTGNSQVAY